MIVHNIDQRACTLLDFDRAIDIHLIVEVVQNLMETCDK